MCCFILKITATLWCTTQPKLRNQNWQRQYLCYSNQTMNELMPNEQTLPEICRNEINHKFFNFLWNTTQLLPFKCHVTIAHWEFSHQCLNQRRVEIREPNHVQCGLDLVEIDGVRFVAIGCHERLLNVHDKLVQRYIFPECNIARTIVVKRLEQHWRCVDCDIFSTKLDRRDLASINCSRTI